MINVSIIGATGYVGAEITRILAGHPGIKIKSLVSHSFQGKKMSDIYPNLKGIADMECIGMNLDEISRDCDICITALPHGVSMEVVPELVARGKRVIDHSGDFRYKEVKIYENWYNISHLSPQLLKESVYGLPELYRDKIRNARIVANPGCYPTCSILGLAPLLSQGLINKDSIIIDAASGITGAGRKADLEYMYCESADNYKAYKIASHRHTSEIEQELGFLSHSEITVTFTPHLVPMKRGMLATIYAQLADNTSIASLVETYRKYYRDEFFIRIMDEGIFPETKNVAGSNFIDIGLTIDKRTNRVIVLSALDNLGKGAATQAVQALNIMLGFDEKEGLKNPGYYL